MKRHPEWSDIEAALEKARNHSGVVTLDIYLSNETGQKTLQVRVDDGHYLLLTLGEEDEQDYAVRSLTNAKAGPGQIGILGDLWDSRMVSDDFTIVQQAFEEFFSTGNVSHNLLQ